VLVLSRTSGRKKARVGGDRRDDDGALRLGPREKDLLGRDLLARGDRADDAADGALRVRERAAPEEQVSELSPGRDGERETDMSAE
jgi:hypothetical protein